MSTRGLVHGLARVRRPAGSDVRDLTAAGAPARLRGHEHGVGTGRACARLGVHGCARGCACGGLGTDGRACQTMASCDLESPGGLPSPRRSPVPLSPLLSAAAVNTFCRRGSALS